MERKRVLVIGRTGQLARCLMEQWSQNSRALNVQDIGTGDCNVCLREPFKEGYLEAFAPDAIINTAAFHDLRACEADFDTAFRVNALGVANILSAMPEGCHLYQISTDYVFGWAANHSQPAEVLDECRAYGPHLPTFPLNNYGRTKRAGELIALDSGRATVIRTASLFSKYGSSGKGGSNFLLGILKRASECNAGWIDRDGRDGGRVGAARADGKVLPLGCQIAVDSDVVMSPTYTPWLARAILYMVSEDMRPPIAHLVCDGPPVSWYDFAKVIFECGMATGYHRNDEEVLQTFKSALARLLPKKSDDWPPRPRFSALENSVPRIRVGTWQAALEHFFEWEWPSIVEATA